MEGGGGGGGGGAIYKDNYAETYFAFIFQLSGWARALSCFTLHFSPSFFSYQALMALEQIQSPSTRP